MHSLKLKVKHCYLVFRFNHFNIHLTMQTAWQLGTFSTAFRSEFLQIFGFQCDFTFA